jgi:adenine-specific DNA-methyltransferase
MGAVFADLLASTLVDAQRWPKLTLKKIPKMVKDRCEWGHDDYSLNVANFPIAQKAAEVPPAQDDLFGGDGT